VNGGKIGGSLPEPRSPIAPPQPEGGTIQAISGADSPFTPPGGLLPTDTTPRRPAAAFVPRKPITLPEGETPQAIPGADSPITPPEGFLQQHYSGYHHTRDSQSYVPEPHLHNEKVGPSSTRPADPPRGQGDSTIHRAAPVSSGTLGSLGCPRQEEGATATTVAVSDPKSVSGPPFGMTHSFLHKTVTIWAD
jgi:hypothetical protein